MYEFKENYRYFLNASGGRTLLYAAGKLRLDDLAKILDQWLGRNNGNVEGKTVTITLTELGSTQLYNLKGEPVSLNKAQGLSMAFSLPKVSDDVKAKLVSIIKGALIAGAGVALVTAAESLKVVDFGDNTGIAVAVASVLVNVGKVLLKL